MARATPTAEYFFGNSLKRVRSVKSHIRVTRLETLKPEDFPTGAGGIREAVHTGGGGDSVREKLLWEKFCPKFRDSILPRVLSLGTEFFPHF